MPACPKIKPGEGDPDGMLHFSEAEIESFINPPSPPRPPDEPRWSQHQPDWPPPKPIRTILVAARKRYREMRLTDRPCLDQPYNACTLFTRDELVVLAKRRWWPLSQRTLNWLRVPPPVRARRQRQRERVIAGLVRKILTAELPEAVTLLVRAALAKMRARRPS